MKIDVLDVGFVQYVDHMGSDIDVANAARVSFHKESVLEKDGSLSERDAKLIRYLARHNHFTPLAQVNLKLRIKLPIFVARQLMRSNIGIVWNEVSRRYVDTPPEFYIPKEWRSRPEGGLKQGSGKGIKYSPLYEYGVEKYALSEYNNMLKKGVAPEMARMVLPQSTYTEVIGNFTLAALARVCALREDSHAQVEIQRYARAMGEIAKEYFPVSWEALTGGTNAQP